MPGVVTERREELNDILGSDRIEVRAAVAPEYAPILTPAALRFVADLERRFGPMRRALLARRAERQRALDAGELPDFLPGTLDLRTAEWTVAPMPPDLTDRRVEITGPAERKMIVNGLNSGANVFMADFEDAHTPTWENNLSGQVHLRAAVAGTLAFTSPEGKEYRLGERVATLMVRPRGWHLVEKHLLIDGAPISAALFDFGLFAFHNARALVQRGSAPYFYLPKLENHLEARLWNDVFVRTQEVVGIPRGSIRATVLIETILAGFEMDEILWELRDHSAGLNCGRWDYIFSFIKKFRSRRDFLLPDRSRVTMDRAFLRAYVDLLIRTCHRRGIHAMGGMAAQIPIKNDAAANATALEKVRADKLREVRAGHDGTWVAHPGLVPIAREVFAAHGPGPHQIGAARDPIEVRPADLLAVPDGEITEAGLRLNLDVGIQYLASWLSGTGCVPIYHLMEDAATAEISRSQVWQWVRHGARLADGREVTAARVRAALGEEMGKLRARGGPAAARLEEAGEIFTAMTLADEMPEFLTLITYERLP